MTWTNEELAEHLLTGDYSCGWGRAMSGKCQKCCEAARRLRKLQRIENAIDQGVEDFDGCRLLDEDTYALGQLQMLTAIRKAAAQE